MTIKIWEPNEVYLIKVTKSLSFKKFQTIMEIANKAGIDYASTQNILRNLYFADMIDRQKIFGKGFEYCFKHPREWIKK